MSFSAAKNLLSTIHQTELDQLFTSWTCVCSISAQAIKNITNDNSMQPIIFSKLLEDFTNSKSLILSSPFEAKKSFEIIGVNYYFSGYNSECYKDAIFGRAILLDKYAKYYIKDALDSLGCYDSESIIIDSLRKLNNVSFASVPDDLEIYVKAIKQTLLGKVVLFATFVKNDHRFKGPWNANINARWVRSSLALGEDLPGRDYMLFTYKLPADVIPHVPTVASPGWNYQKWFRPNPTSPTDLHGWTEPLEPELTKLPELVHAEVNGSTIIEPIKIAKS